MDEGEGEAQVDTGQCHGQEKHGEQLGVDAAADVLLRHAHLLHDGEAALVLVALADLLVVDDGDGGQ